MEAEHTEPPKTTSEAANFELLDYVGFSTKHEETFHFLGFEFLHRLNIVRIQNNLIAFKEGIVRDGENGFDHERLTTLLESYGINFVT